MTVLALFAWPVMIFVWGFFPVAMALLGKADVPTALKSGIVPGALGAIMAFWFWFTANTLYLPVLGQAVPAPIEVLYLAALVLGVAAAAFLLVGFAGFTFKGECMSCIANVVNFVGIPLLILGAYMMYYLYSTIGGPFATPGLIGGFGVFLFGVCCLMTGMSVLGKVKGAWGIMAIVAINFIIAFYLLIA